MSPQICLITGANSGIGFQTAKALAQKGLHVILHARSEEKAQDAKDRILKTYPDASIETAIAELNSMTQIRKMAADVQAKHKKIDLLINNAGFYTGQYESSEEGIESQFAVNHLAHFLLTHLLLPELKNAPSARIVHVSSDAHLRGKLYLNRVNESENYKGMRAYGQSKLANVLFSNELARRLSNTHIVSNSLHPGVVRTHIGNKHSALLGLVWKLFKPIMLSEADGAKTSIHLASSPDVQGITGKYFSKCKESKTSSLAHDQNLANELWAHSCEWCGIEDTHTL